MSSDDYFRVHEHGEIWVVDFAKARILDDQSMQVIGPHLLGLADHLGARKMLLNFGNIEYISSAVLATLITLNSKVSSAGGRLALCNLDPQIYEVFEITKLDRFFRFEKDIPPDTFLGGVKSKLIPPKPTSGSSVKLWTPPPDGESE